MKNNIKKTLKQKLHENYEIKKSFEKINSCKNNNETFSVLFEIFETISKYYNTDQEINNIFEQYYNNNIITEQDDKNPIFKFFSNLFNKENKYEINPDEKKEIKKDIGYGFVSQFKEYLLNFILNRLGFKGALAKGFATFFADMELRNIIQMFRDKERCLFYGDQFGESILESIVAMVIETSTDGRSIGYDIIRNQVFSNDFLENAGQKISKKMCEVFHKKNIKNEIINNMF